MNTSKYANEYENEATKGYKDDTFNGNIFGEMSKDVTGSVKGDDSENVNESTNSVVNGNDKTSTINTNRDTNENAYVFVNGYKYDVPNEMTLKRSVKISLILLKGM